MNRTFVSTEQELWWKAFSGQCGEEFKGHPVFMEGFMECEHSRNADMQGKHDLGREM